MRDLVDRRVRVLARRRRPRAAARQRDVPPVGRVDFELVDARLQAARLVDRETQPLRRHRREALGVHARVHRRTRKRLPGDRLHRVRINTRLDRVRSREAVLELLLAVAPPHDPVDHDRLREFQLHPPAADFVGDPAIRIADPTVVNVRELVDRRVRIRSRSRRLRAAGRQRDVSAVGRINLQLIDARLDVARFVDREAHELRHRRRKFFLIE